MNPLYYDHPRVVLVKMLQRLYDFGMTTTSGGNISIKDADGNIWITPSGIDKGTLKPEDIMMVKPDGDVIGCHKPSCELPFHREVYSKRPDVRSVLHAHSPALVAFSMIGECPDPSLIPGAAKVCGKVAFSRYDIPGSLSLGHIIAAEFEKGADSVMMENHGAVVCGKDVSEAFRRFETLDFTARMQINARGLQKALVHPQGELAPADLPEFVADAPTPNECYLRDQIIKMRNRSYRQYLLFSGSAFFATRLGDDDFLITPDGFDPMAMDVSDIVRVYHGQREAGKQPSCMVNYVREYFKQFPWCNAIILTRPPNAMAFACTSSHIDSRTIPESYIQMRDMPLVDCKAFCADVQNSVKQVSPANPVLLIENNGIMTFGKTLTEAFDRMEVSEFTAKCLLLAQRIGKFKPITGQQVEDIINAFGLPR